MAGAQWDDWTPKGTANSRSLPEHVHWLFVGDNTVDNDRDERAALFERAQSSALQTALTFPTPEPMCSRFTMRWTPSSRQAIPKPLGPSPSKLWHAKCPSSGPMPAERLSFWMPGRSTVPRNAEALAEAVIVLMQEAPLRPWRCGNERAETTLRNVIPVDSRLGGIASFARGVGAERVILGLP